MNTTGFTKTPHSYIVKYKGYKKEFEFGGGAPSSALVNADKWINNIDLFLSLEDCKSDADKYTRIMTAITLGFVLIWDGKIIKGVYKHTSNFNGNLQIQLEDNQKIIVHVNEIEILTKKIRHEKN
jgi:hypothetical protein